MNQEQIEAVHHSDNPEQAALALVETGDATLIEFSSEHITGRCGTEKRNLEQSSAASVGGWAAVFSRIRWDAEAEGSVDGLLFRDADSLIVTGHMRDDDVGSIIEVIDSLVVRLMHGE